MTDSCSKHTLFDEAKQAQYHIVHTFMSHAHRLSIALKDSVTFRAASTGSSHEQRRQFPHGLTRRPSQGRLNVVNTHSQCLLRHQNDVGTSLRGPQRPSRASQHGLKGVSRALMRYFVLLSETEFLNCLTSPHKRSWSPPKICDTR